MKEALTLNSPTPHRFVFITLGVISLIGWNATLNALDFFTVKLPVDGQGPAFWFPIPFQFANFIFGLLMPYLSQQFSQKLRIVTSVLILSCFLIVLVVTALIFPDSLGYYLCLVICFILGSLNSVAQNTMIALSNLVDGELTGLYWVGTGISGIVMNILRAFALVTFGEKTDLDKTLGTLMYFIMAVLISIFGVYQYDKFTKTDYYQQKVGQSTDKSDQSLHSIVETDIQKMNEDPTETFIDNSSVGKTISDMGIAAKETPFQTAIRAFLAAFPYPLFIWVIYVFTFMLFPGVGVFSNQYFGISFSWSSLILLTTFNLGDIFGQWVAGFRQYYNGALMIAMTIGRGLFFLTFYWVIQAPGSYINVSEDSWAVFNMFMFASTNGYCTTGLMMIGPEKSDEGQIKGTIGFLGGFFLTFGITCGTFLALAVQGIYQK